MKARVISLMAAAAMLLVFANRRRGRRRSDLPEPCAELYLERYAVEFFFRHLRLYPDYDQFGWRGPGTVTHDHLRRPGRHLRPGGGKQQQRFGDHVFRVHRLDCRRNLLPEHRRYRIYLSGWRRMPIGAGDRLFSGGSPPHRYNRKSGRRHDLPRPNGELTQRALSSDARNDGGIRRRLRGVGADPCVHFVRPGATCTRLLKL